MIEIEQPKKVHHGRNIKRFRELFGLKQEALALELGPDWSQKKVSRLEEHEVVEDEILKQIALVLKIPKEAIENFTEEAAINYFNTFNDNSGSGSCSSYSTFNFNAPEDYKQLIEENKKLYESLLTAEREKVALLEKLLNERK
ncbi:transcriptional regulator [Niabella ginsenosidivorans]|uniref:Transcriptional regulator n=1 Tax=Niabella ginsenosidivorans TaxID=1176587 RepID=A0A1A9I2B6_9BACT|nr:helix-turn-helix transcriptional regulator [Niabella ginsenosidivorans]ANH81673.1 transcriptional regulator [Niabella ginsenosidivorans]